MQKKETATFSLVSFLSKHGLTAALGVLLLVLPFNIAYHFDSSRAYIEGRFVNYLDFVVHIVDVGVLVWLATALYVGKLWRDRRFLKIVVLLGALVLFQLVVFRNAVVLYTGIRLFLYGSGVAAIVLINRISAAAENGKWLKNIAVPLLFCVSVSAVLQSVLAIVQFTTGHVLGLSALGESVVSVGAAGGSSVFLSDGYHLRGYGTFPHPNVLGGYLVVSLLLLLRFSENVSAKFRICLIPAILLILAGVGATWSRVAWGLAVIVLVAWGLHFLLLKRIRYRSLTIVAGVVILIAGTLFVAVGTGSLPVSLRGRLIEQTASSDVSVVERKDLADRAFDMLRKHPWTGVGLGQYIPKLSDDPVYTEGGIRVMQPAHSVPLLVLAEVGIVGAALLGAVLYVLFSSTRVSFYLALSVLVYAGMGVLDHYVWTLPQGMILLGMLFLVVLSSQSAMPSLRGKRSSSR